jgi:hypothetical protein
MTKTELRILKRIRASLDHRNENHRSAPEVQEHLEAADLYIRTWVLGPLNDLIDYGEGEVPLRDIDFWARG